MKLVEGAATQKAIGEALEAWRNKETIVFVHPRWVARERETLLASIEPNVSALKSAAAVFFTSGTTGTPKAVLLSREAILASSTRVIGRFAMSPHDRSHVSLPIAHAGGFAVVMRAVLSGSELVDDLEKATIVSLVPAMLHRKLDAGFSRAAHPALRLILLGGAPASPALLERARARGFEVVTTYGLTETFGGVAFDGVPLPDVELRVNAAKTIEVRGPMLMEGYAGYCPLDQGAWFDTGDFGELEDGRIRVLSRRTDLIVSGGENVYPAEVEAVLEAHANVRRACVFGVPHEVWGELVCAAIVPASERFDAKELDVFLGDQLAPFKRPRRVALFRELPETPQGKVDRRETRSQAQTAFEVDSEPPGRDTPST
jgi:O-succinylbenzoic acid--CoA ligase